MVRLVGYQCAGDEAVLPPLADGSAVASLPTAQDEKPVEVSLVQEEAHLRSIPRMGNRSQRASRRGVSLSSPFSGKYGMTSISGVEWRKTNTRWFSTTMQAMDRGEIALLFVGSGPQAKLAQGTSAHLLSSLLRARLLLDQRHVPLKGEHFCMQPTDRESA